MKKIFFILICFLVLVTLGYSATSDDFSISLDIMDNVPPVVDLLSPLNVTYTSSPISLAYSVYDVGGIDTCEYSLNGGANVTVTGNTTFVPASGSNTFYFYCIDFGNNTDFTYVEFDYNPPSQPTGGGGTSYYSNTCPSCREETNWTSCINGLQTRTVTFCNLLTTLKCRTVTETRTCELGEYPQKDLVFLGNLGLDFIIQNGELTDRVKLVPGETVFFKIIAENQGLDDLHNLYLEINNIEYLKKVTTSSGLIVLDITGVYVTNIEPLKQDILGSNESIIFDITLEALPQVQTGVFDVNATVFSDESSDNIVFPIEITETEECCLFGICGSFGICWYMWVLLFFVGLFVSREIKKSEKRK